MTETEIVRRRMRNVRLIGDPFASPAEVVRWFGAVQAQDFGPAKWSVAQRLADTSEADIDRAFARGELLRTHVLRPTWHFVTPNDIRWLLELTAPRVHALNAYPYRQFGVDSSMLRRSHKALGRALSGGRHLTRRELAIVLTECGVETTTAFRLAYILMHAELEGLVCSGAPRGKEHTYALLDERVPPTKRLTRDEAVAELTLRYFRSHGPATPNDFKWWSSLSAADVKRGLELAGDQLNREVVDGVTFWFAASSGRLPRRPAAARVHLIQGYDEYTVGHRETKYLLDLSGRARTYMRERSVFVGIILLDSQVAGHWRRTTMKGGVAVEVALNRRFDATETRALRQAVDRYGSFLGTKPAVVQMTR